MGVLLHRGADPVDVYEHKGSLLNLFGDDVTDHMTGLFGQEKVDRIAKSPTQRRRSWFW